MVDDTNFLGTAYPKDSRGPSQEDWDKYLESSGRPDLTIAQKNDLRRPSDLFWKGFGIFVLVCVIGLGITYLVYADQFNGLIQTHFNNTVNNEVKVENSYDFTPQTENKYSFNPNYTINNYNNVICPGP